MMQNGFRRIALAQGLLPDRLTSREVSESNEPPDVSRLGASEAAGVSPGARDGDPQMRVAGAA